MGKKKGKGGGDAPAGAVSGAATGDKVTAMVQQVKAVCKNASQETILQLLVSNSYDVEKTAEQILGGGAKAAADEWSTKPVTKKKKNKKKNSGGGGGAQQQQQQPAASIMKANAMGKKQPPKEKAAERAAPAPKQKSYEVDSEALKLKEAEELKRQGHQVASSGMRKVDLNMSDFGAIGTPVAPAPAFTAPAIPAFTMPASTPAPIGSLPGVTAVGGGQLGGIVAPLGGFPAADDGASGLMMECQQAVLQIQQEMENKWAEVRTTHANNITTLQQAIHQRDMSFRQQYQQAYAAEQDLLRKRQLYLSTASQPEQFKAFLQAMKADRPVWGQSRYRGDASAVTKSIAQLGAINPVQAQQLSPPPGSQKANGGPANASGPAQNGDAQPQRKKKNRNRKKGGGGGGN